MLSADLGALAAVILFTATGQQQEQIVLQGTRIVASLENAVIGNAQAVMKWDKCPSETDRVIYYDEEENSYFFVTYENWEFAPLFKRNYLDTVRTAELVGLHSQIESYTLDDLFISK